MMIINFLRFFYKVTSIPCIVIHEFSHAIMCIAMRPFGAKLLKIKIDVRCNFKTNFRCRSYVTVDYRNGFSLVMITMAPLFVYISLLFLSAGSYWFYILVFYNSYLFPSDTDFQQAISCFRGYDHHNKILERLNRIKKQYD